MKLRHAAALALVGWYLMLPPLKVEGPASNPNTPVEADTGVPLAQWHVISTGEPFETKAECEAYPAHLIKLLHDPNKPGAEHALKYWLNKSQCFATDDPRLKEQ
ncbi:MAG: hypothetical protein ACYDC3_05925 [Candidatus Binataceae bacterium]